MSLVSTFLVYCTLMQLLYIQGMVLGCQWVKLSQASLERDIGFGILAKNLKTKKKKKVLNVDQYLIWFKEMWILLN